MTLLQELRGIAVNPDIGLERYTDSLLDIPDASPKEIERERRADLLAFLDDPKVFFSDCGDLMGRNMSESIHLQAALSLVEQIQYRIENTKYSYSENAWQKFKLGEAKMVVGDILHKRMRKDLLK